MAKRHRWVRVTGPEPELDKSGLTWVLFSRKEDYLVPEWRPVGQVTYRQVYVTQEPQWYAWTFNHALDHIGMVERSFPSMETAMELVERHFGLDHAEIEVVD